MNGVLLTFSVILLALFVSYRLWRYTSLRRTRLYILGIVWIGWFFAFSVILLLPIDVASVSLQNDSLTPEQLSRVFKEQGRMR